jgi:hypothetical protein
MKVAIIGEKSRAIAWEKHLRKLSSIREVVISTELFSDPEIPAVILINESDGNLRILNEAIRLGLHTFLISRLPSDQKMLESVYHAAGEAGTAVQFSHWPSITPSTQWIRQQIQKPDLIQIKKEIRPVNYSVDIADFDHHWTDEVAFIVKWMGGNAHRIEAKPVLVEGVPLGLHLTIRFEDASVASLQFSAFGTGDMHQRIFSDRKMMVDCDVTSQHVRLYRVNDQKRITIQEKKFDPADTAGWALQQFFKSIQMKKETVFSPYDALLTSRIIDKVRSHMAKW